MIGTGRERDNRRVLNTNSRPSDKITCRRLTRTASAGNDADKEVSSVTVKTSLATVENASVTRMTSSVPMETSLATEEISLMAGETSGVSVENSLAIHETSLSAS